MSSFLGLASVEASEAGAGASACSPDQWDWQSDWDPEVRLCSVDLWARPLNRGWAQAANSTIGSTPATQGVTSNHWSLVFHWDDTGVKAEERAATYEANDYGGYLLPRWHDGVPKGDQWDVRTIRNLGSYKLSPKTVNMAAKANRLNGNKYILGHQNCQQWVSVLAADLHIELNEQTLAEKSPVEAVLASGLGMIMGNPQAAVLTGMAAGVIGLGVLAGAALLSPAVRQPGDRRERPL